MKKQTSDRTFPISIFALLAIFSLAFVFSGCLDISDDEDEDDDDDYSASDVCEHVMDECEDMFDDEDACKDEVEDIEQCQMKCAVKENDCDKIRDCIESENNETAAGYCREDAEDGDTPDDGDSPEDGDTPMDGDYPDDGDTPMDGDYPDDGDVPDDALLQCMQTECSQSYNACFGNSDCMAIYVDCPEQCGDDDACFNNCAEQHMGGIDLANEFADCVVANCDEYL